jgi:8-oxo-dGTP pyrophosphatase MutT (NUDIX family)
VAIVKSYFAQKAFIIEGECILLVRKSADDPDQAGRWEVPGGRMEFGEDVDEHLRREVREEVGLDVRPGPPFYLWQWRLNRQGQNGESLDIQIVAAARICRPGSGEISDRHRVEGDFLDETRWVHINELLKYDLIPNMIPVVQAFCHHVRSQSTSRMFCSDKDVDEPTPATQMAEVSAANRI